MYEDVNDGTVDFVRSVRELIFQQREAVDRCNHGEVRCLGNQLKMLLPSLIRVIKTCKVMKCSHAEEIIGLVKEIRELQHDSTEKMIRERDRLAVMLQDIRKGRRMLDKYHTDNSVKQVFEMQG